MTCKLCHGLKKVIGSFGGWFHVVPCTMCSKEPSPIERAFAAVTGPTPPPAEPEVTQRRVLAFLNDLRDPEGFGHAVTTEVRSRARELVKELEAHGG